MKIIFLVVALFGLVICRPEDKYTTKYDNIDVEEILKSDRLLNSYFDCLLTGKGCTPAGKELQETLPDALQTECTKCSDKQKATAKRILHFVIDNKPDMYKKVEAKFDPEGIYKKKYKAKIEAEGYDVSKL